MSVATDEVLEMIGKMPASVTTADIMGDLYYKEQIERGLTEVAEGRSIGHDELRGEWRNGGDPPIAEGCRERIRDRELYGEGLAAACNQDD